MGLLNILCIRLHVSWWLDVRVELLGGVNSSPFLHSLFSAGLLCLCCADESSNQPLAAYLKNGQKNMWKWLQTVATMWQSGLLTFRAKYGINRCITGTVNDYWHVILELTKRCSSHDCKMPAWCVKLLSVCREVAVILCVNKQRCCGEGSSMLRYCAISLDKKGLGEEFSCPEHTT